MKWLIYVLVGYWAGCMPLWCLAQESQPATTAPTDSAPTESAPSVYTVIQGQVLNELGEGLSGVRVMATGLDDAGLSGTASSSDYGDFAIRLDGEHPGRYRLVFTVENYAESQKEIEVSADDLEPFVDVVLRGALSLTGEVVEFLEDQPLVGAKVHLKTDYRSKTATTDEAGRFIFEELLPGDARLVIEAEGYGKEKQQVKVRAGLPLMRVTLRPERVLRVRVENEEGKPIVDAAVEVEIDEHDFRQVATDSQGVALIKQIRFDARLVRIRASHSDYVSTGQFSEAVEWPVDSFEMQQTVRLQPAGRLHGRVVNAGEERPLNGARVDVGTTLEEGNPYAFSDMEGLFEVSGVEPGQAIVTVSVAGYAPQLVEITVIARETVEIKVVMEPGRTIHGLVRGVDDQPIAGAQITALKWRQYQTLGLFTRTNNDGEFLLDHAPLDEFLLDIYAAQQGRLADQIISREQNEYAFKLDGSFAVDERFSPCAAKVGDTLPTATLTSLAHGQFDAAALRQKVVLIDFWATWCSPCVAEMPNIRELYKQYGQREDFVLLGISMDYQESDLRSFLEKEGVTWPMVFGSGSGADDWHRRLEVRAIPCTILVGRNGQIQAIGLTGTELRTRAEKLLNETP